MTRFSPEIDAEFDTIQRSFPEARQVPGAPPPPQPDNRPDRDQLVGLALSGGGIRSATFGLGVLEALKREGLLPRIHYLSTVSGGGYIGAWFTANCRRAFLRGERDWRDPQADWVASIRHLRRYSNYLSPEVGFFSADTWSMFTVWFRNALLIQWTVAMVVACVLLLPRLLVLPFSHWYTYGYWRWCGVLVFLLAVVGIAGNQQWVSRDEPPRFLRAASWRKGALLAGLGLGLAIALGVRTGFDPFHGQRVHPGVALAMAAVLVAVAFCLTPVMAVLYARALRRPVADMPVNYTQTLVQVWIVVPMLLTGFCVGAVLWAETLAGDLSTFDTYGAFLVAGWRYWPFPLAIVFCSLWLLSLCSVKRIRNLRAFVTASLAPFVCVIVLHAALSAIMLLLRTWRSGGVAHAFVLAPPLVLFAFSLAVVALIGMMGRQSTEGAREWWSRLGAWLLIYGTSWMVVALAAVYGPTWVYAAFSSAFWTSLGGALTWLGTVGAGLVAGHSAQTGRQEDGQSRNPVFHVAALVAPYLFIAGLLLGVATVLDQIVIRSAGRSWWSLTDPAAHWSVFGVSLVALTVSGVTLFILGFRIDINEFSLNAFYCNRLVRCFLGATRTRPKERTPQNFTGFDDADDIGLVELIERDGSLNGPFPIVNCALNLGGSGDLSLHTRHSASFTLTPLQAGSDYGHGEDAAPAAPVGFLPMADGTQTGRTTLGRAIAVSGAAASPNMGYHTSPVVSFLLTVFNLRLGWWFPRPTGAGTRNAPRFNLPYMLFELFGGATHRSGFLMISDGGHFENLAVYELIKRRCRVIIASDAECDPRLTFEGLGTLIRMCAVDLGVVIDIDVGALRQRAGTTWSAQRSVVGRIIYDDACEGTLIYLKASMNGHEPTGILQYKASHPTFPHETTGDQFYSEDQFESYRHLGYEIASQTFKAALRARPVHNPTSMVAFAETTRKTCAPALHETTSFTAHADGLIALWDKIRGDSTLASLDLGLTAGGLPAGSVSLSRLEFYTCVEMIQLMENVYLDLQLEETWDHADNHGWRQLFIQWTRTPQVKETWKSTRQLFGERFQFFCQRELGLR